MKLAIVSAHTNDFYYLFKTQFALLKLNDPTVKVIQAKSNAPEQFPDEVEWVDLEFPDYIHERHRKSAVKFNFGRPMLAKKANADRVAWVDTDILPLEHNSMTEFLTMCDKPTVANPVPYGDYLKDQWAGLIKWYGYENIPCHNCGLVGAPGDSTFWDEWSDTMRELYLSKLDYFLNTPNQTHHYEIPLRMFCIDQLAMNIVISRDPSKFNYVDPSYNFLPLEKEGDFFKDYTKLPSTTKMVHLTGTSKKSLLINPESL